MSKLYGEWAFIWEALTPDDAYCDEALLYWSLLNDGRTTAIQSLVELGSGGGYLAQHLDQPKHLILIDQSEVMLALSKKRNPSAVHLCADMCHADYGHRADAVLIHDAIMYLTSREAVAACLRNAIRQLNPKGRILIVPDLLKETFFENIVSGEGQIQERHVHLTEWRWKPEMDGNAFKVAFSALMRHAEAVQSLFEVHEMAYLSYLEWLELFNELGLRVHQIDFMRYELPRELFLLSLKE